MYIAIEGIDTAGKSTQVKNVVSELDNALPTYEPGNTRLGMGIRKLIFDMDISNLAEYFLFLADRAEHIEKVIKPNLHLNIVSDRSMVSGIAYAKANNVVSTTKIVTNSSIATDNVHPDITFILELDKETLEERLNGKVMDHIESRGIDYLLEVQKNLIESCNHLRLRYVTINASKSEEDITDTILKYIKDMEG